MAGPPRADPRADPRTASFYLRGAEELAPALLGHTLVRRLPDGTVRRARIVETEAYVGEHDLASHARAGRTPRTQTMYGPPGHAYVYLVYGVHHMLNVVCAPTGDPQAVLIRAAEPLDGWDARMAGPGLVAASLGLTRRDDGANLLEGALTLEPGSPPHRIATGPRVGVDYAGEWARKPLRFMDAQSAHASRPRIGGLSSPPRHAALRGRPAF